MWVPWWQVHQTGCPRTIGSCDGELSNDGCSEGEEEETEHDDDDEEDDDNDDVDADEEEQDDDEEGEEQTADELD
jgi:hypothetical protein